LRKNYFFTLKTYQNQKQSAALARRKNFSELL